MLGRTHGAILQERSPKSKSFLSLCKLLVLLLLDSLSSEVFIWPLLIHGFLLPLYLRLDLILYRLLYLWQLPIQIFSLPHQLCILIGSVIIGVSVIYVESGLEQLPRLLIQVNLVLPLIHWVLLLIWRPQIVPLLFLVDWTESTFGFSLVFHLRETIVVIIVLWGCMVVLGPVLIEVFVELHLFVRVCLSEISHSLSLLDDSS